MSTYTLSITLAVDVAQTHYDASSHVATLADGAAIPPSVAGWARENGEAMPNGVYGFVGQRGAEAVLAELDYHNQHRSGHAPPWDLSADVVLARHDASKPQPSMIWKNPRHLQGAHIGVGVASKETNDLLRYFVGDRYAADRLTLEPWRIDEYAAVLQAIYGPLRVVLFDAMTAGGHIKTMIRVYDPSVLPAGIQPLYRWLSAVDPEQPSFALPNSRWSGWGVPPFAVNYDDLSDVMHYYKVLRDNPKEKKGLFDKRVLQLRKENRFQEKQEAISEVVKKRVEMQYHEKKR